MMNNLATKMINEFNSLALKRFGDIDIHTFYSNALLFFMKKYFSMDSSPFASYFVMNEMAIKGFKEAMEEKHAKEISNIKNNILDNIDFNKLWFKCRELSYDRTAEKYLKLALVDNNAFLSAEEFDDLKDDLLILMNEILPENGEEKNNVS